MSMQERANAMALEKRVAALEGEVQVLRRIVEEQQRQWETGFKDYTLKAAKRG